MEGDFDDMIASSVVDAKGTKIIPVIDVDADSSESQPELEADTTPTVSSSSAKQRATRKPIPGPAVRMQWAKAKQAAPKRDEYAVYGEYVGEKLRNAGKSRLEIARAQQDIEAIFIKLESGIYGKPG
ncbi:uncharacterized protein LOC131259357 [Anopheles coustani]|nr:uncharacterized protein LOC131259357 [Anopheles coustani]